MTAAITFPCTRWRTIRTRDRSCARTDGTGTSVEDHWRTTAVVAVAWVQWVPPAAGIAVAAAAAVGEVAVAAGGAVAVAGG